MSALNLNGLIRRRSGILFC